jgi:hypothetical protein
MGLALVAVSAWPPSSFAPSAGWDGGWMTGLQLAQARGLDWGREIAFTYGPLGFIAVPQVWNLTSLVGGFVYAGLAVASITVAPYLVLSRQSSRAFAFALAGALALAAPTQIFVPELLSLGALLFAIASYQDALSLRPITLAGLIGALTAIQALVKPPVAAIAVLACVLVVLAPKRGALQRAGAAAASFVIVFVAGWLAATHQSVLDLDEWFASVIDLARYYSEAMFVVPLEGGYQYIAAALLVAGLVGYVARFAIRIPSRRSVVAVILVAFALWITAKEAFVRQDIHSALFMFTIPALAAVVRTRRAATRPLALLVAIGLVFTTLATGSTLAAELDPGPSLKSALRQLTYIAFKEQRRSATEAARAQLVAGYAIPDSVLRTVSGRKVHVDPYETSLAWAYRFHWRPAPVFQRYQAYTARSDRSNAATLASSSDGPQRIVRQESTGLDGRNLLWDSPRYMLTLVCLYRQEQVVPPWQVLSRVSPRCGPIHYRAPASFRADTEIVVPRASRQEVVVVWLRWHQSFYDRLRAAIFRPAGPVVVNAGGIDYRIPTLQVAGPLLLRVPETVGWAPEFGGRVEYNSLRVNRDGLATFATLRVDNG